MSTLSEEQLKEYKETFVLFDTNKDEKISRDELDGMVKKLGLNVEEAELNLIMQKADTDRDGYISFEEFLAVMTSDPPIDENDIIKEAFQILDKNKTGKLSAEVMKESLERLGEMMSEEDVDEVIRAIDDNEDGFIDYEEFLKVLKK